MVLTAADVRGSLRKTRETVIAETPAAAATPRIVARARDTSAQNPRQLVSMLLAGRIDIIIGDRVQLMYFVREQRAEQHVRILPKPLVEMPRYVAFAKGDSVRAKQFAAALERLRQNGKLDQIYQRWQ